MLAPSPPGRSPQAEESSMSTPAAPVTPGKSHTIPLSVMMFLQFFLWGAWFVTLGPFMAAHQMGGDKLGTWIGNAYSTAPIAAILAPFFLGVVADRFFASQRVMGALHALGGALLLLAPSLIPKSGVEPTLFVGVLLAHMLCYMPTLGLSNTVAFNCMNNPEKQFPLIRVWGTIGWIIAGLMVGYVAQSLFPYAKFLVEGFTLESFEAARTALAGKQPVDPDTLAKFTQTKSATEAARNASPHFFYIAGASGVVLGFFSFMLPNTPPPMKGKPTDIGAILGRDAVSLLKDRSFLIFTLASLLICIPLAAYYSMAGTYVGAYGIENIPVKMTFGQMSEIGFMLVMPLFFARLGVKWMLAVGMLAWVIRYALFAGAWSSGGPQDDLKWMVLAGIILHGICYDFFFVTGQIYVERKASPDIRGQAQGFLVLITQGVGMLIGNQLIGRLKDHYTSAEGVTDWKAMWIAPAVFAAVIMLIFIALFRNGGEQNKAASA
jgi:MFS family permease